MNKQELIEKVIENGAWCTESHTGETDRYVKISKVRELIVLLDEPRKPVVPKFVAEWFEEHKDDLETSIFYECVRAMEICKEDRNEFHQWFANSKNNPIETLIRMKDGYEVEKEPSWIVKRLDGTIVTQFALWGQDGKYWGIDTSHPKPLIFTNKEKADAVALLLDGEVVEG